MKCCDQLVAANGTIVVNFKNYVLVVILFAVIERNQPHTWKASQSVLVGDIVATVGVDNCIYVVKIGKTHCGTYLDHLAVGSGMNDVIEPGKAEISH